MTLKGEEELRKYVLVAPHCGLITAAKSSGPDGQRHESSVLGISVTALWGSRVLRTISVGVAPTEVWSLTQMPTSMDICMIGASIANLSVLSPWSDCIENLLSKDRSNIDQENENADLQRTHNHRKEMYFD